MIKQHIHQNRMTLSGKAVEIKKTLHALLQDDGGKATVTQYLSGRTSRKKS